MTPKDLHKAGGLLGDTHQDVQKIRNISAVKHDAVDVRDTMGLTPLMVAAQEGNIRWGFYSLICDKTYGIHCYWHVQS